MFVLNNFTLDQRVAREAKTLADAGHDVTVYALLDNKTVSHEIIDGVKIVRVPPSERYHQIVWIIGMFLGANSYPSVIWRKVCRIFRKSESSSNGAATRSEDKAASEKGETARHGWFRRTYGHARGAALDMLKRARLSDYYNTILDLLRHQPPDVFHAHDLNTLPLACRGKKRFGGKVIYDSHELYTGSAYITGRLAHHLWVRQERKLIRQADAVITVCDSIAQELERIYRIELPVTLRNCPELPESLDQDASLRKLLELPEDLSIVLYQGKLSRGRGLEHLIEATRQIEKAAIVFMGWGPIEDELKQTVKDQELQHRLFIIPPVPPSQLLSWTASADIGVSPIEPIFLSYHYSLPNKVFEYISAGIPVAASRLPEMQRLIEQHEVGVTFEPGNPADMAGAINRLLKDPDAIAEMKQNARLASQQELNWGAESQKLLKVYQKFDG